MENITKKFGSIVANHNINLELHEGEILSLLGENGSGKTTLMNMLSGIYYPDEGQIYIHGKPVTIASPKDAFDNGIGMIHQHFKLVDVFTATENIVLGLEGKLELADASKKVREICEKYGFDIDPNQKIYDMSVSQKQTVEIVKVLYRGADILILDEPTAVLTPQETDKLFQIMRNMKADGKSLIIITHKLHEVLEVSDRVAVLRKGEYIGDVMTKDADQQSLTDMMVGRSVSLNINRPDPVNVTPRVVVDGLTVYDELGVKRLSDVSFTINAGEVLGIAGVAGSGQRELLESIAGLYPIASGTITYYSPDSENGRNLVGMDPMDIRKNGIAMSFVPEDRLGMGLVGSMGMTGNMMLRSWRKGNSPFVNRKDPEALAKRIWDELEVVTPSTSFPVRRMSGGNVQKVLVGREIAQSPSVLMTAYAVRGLDINTSYTIYNLLTEQKMKGVAVVYVGEDLDVLLELCDRIVVLCGGQVSGVVDARKTDKRQVGVLMTRVEGGKAKNE
ncbi:MAG: ABC transporter ATP-binding protein [Eubacteriales bacterium]|nr:ABC transporter ATP-binding protein [Clostridiales bacterium]MDD7493841.1 ABC transporter ATP-binding protein [Clostridiales bacterium]MDY4895727.1 ABC transporter ATP-binding protein [Eubacteriales bacterium]MDY5675666.1 ABC transporter ATP-binding protein [Eubacteriales bacterium]MDY5709887.1 ABC transporter ATP-binding protein [Eubacteriales bacterium]